MFKKLTQVVLIGFLAWAYQTTPPLPPKICVSPVGPSITPTSIKLRDGRHLAYKEHGVLKADIGHSSRHDLPIAIPELAEELGVYFVSFDRPGYGKSDPNPTGAIESIVLDIEELADQLELVPKLYVIGFSMGGNMAWGCLKYIPHRLAGAALLAPAINYWLSGFPANLCGSQSTISMRPMGSSDGSLHWWTSQNGFPVDCAMSGGAKYSRQDLEIMPKLAGRQLHKECVTREGQHEAFFRDIMIGFSGWGMDPMDLKNPFHDSEGSVHLWQGDEDGLVPVTLQRYIAERLPWIHYYEIAGAGICFHRQMVSLRLS